MNKSFIAGFVILCLCVISFFSVFAIERIDSGQTGIMVNLAGSERGVDDAKIETGWVFYNRFAKQLYEYPSYAILVDYQPFSISNKDGEEFTSDPTIEFYIKREDASKVFLRYRQNIKELKKTVILNEVKNAYKDICGIYKTDSLINNKPQFEKEVEDLLSQRLNERGFTLSNIQSSVLPNEPMQKAINEKNISVQLSIKAENELKIEEANSKKKIIKANAEAESNRILQQTITDKLIQKMAIEKWDGKLPQVSGGATPFVNLN